MRDTSELLEDAVSKNPIISKVFLEKIFEFLLYHYIFGLKATLLLMPLLNHCSIEKRDGKKDSIWPIKLSGFKIVFTLLAEIELSRYEFL